MGPNTAFQPVLTENVAEPSKVERVVLLSGKMYYDLVKRRAERKLDGRVVFVRVEVSRRCGLTRLTEFRIHQCLLHT